MHFKSKYHYFVFASIASALLWLWLYNSSLGHYLEITLQRKFEFIAQDFFKSAPPHNPKIKIFALDDRTISSLKKTDLSPNEWIEIFEYFSQFEPQAIIVDKTFHFFKDPGISTGKNLAPIYPISFGSPNEMTNMPSMDILWFKEKNKDMTLKIPESRFKLIPELALKKMEVNKLAPYVYGPSDDLTKFITSIGHGNHEGNGYFYPFLYTDFDQAIPHISISFAKNINFKTDPIEVDGVKIHTNRFGTTQPNLLVAKSRTIYSLLPFYETRFSKENNANINKEDIIILLPGFNTSSGDFKETPIGKVHGGMIVFSAINSIISNAMIVFYDKYSPIFLIGFAIIGVICAMIPNFVYSLIFLLIINVGTIYSGLVGFSNAFVVIPWLFSIFSLNSGYFPLFTFRAMIYFKRNLLLRSALKNFYSKSQIEYMMKNSRIFFETNKSETITIMFIDIVGFSRYSEEHTPDYVFKKLDGFFEFIRDLVHKHDGVINKTLGDGFLCVFSETKLTDSESSNKSFTDRAFNCAIEIQRRNIELNMERDLTFPLRIGLHTGTVFYGNLGDEDNPDLTYIGHAVNYAQRMEAACENFKILMSPTSKGLLGSMSATTLNIEKKFIAIKNRSDMAEAYEYDPLKDYQFETKKALDEFNLLVGLKRVHDRWLVPQSANIQLFANNQKGRIINFSHTGLCVALPKYFGRNVKLDLQISIDDKSVYNITAEVKWGNVEGDQYVHGIQLLTTLTHNHDQFIADISQYCAASKINQDSA